MTVLHSGFMGEGGDRFQEEFSAANSPFTVDITDDAELTIDVGKGTVER